MKKFNVPVIYSFGAFFIVRAETAEEAQQIVETKVKISEGAILTNSVNIQDKVVSELFSKVGDIIDITEKWEM